MRSPGCPVWLYCCVVLRSLWRGRDLLVLKRNHRIVLFLAPRMRQTSSLFFSRGRADAQTSRFEFKVKSVSAFPPLILFGFMFLNPHLFCPPKNPPPNPIDTSVVVCFLFSYAKGDFSQQNKLHIHFIFFKQCTEREASERSL